MECEPSTFVSIMAFVGMVVTAMVLLRGVISIFDDTEKK